jgi:hypothetical protein
MPVWLLAMLMSVATYRLTRLIVKDDFPPVLWLRDHLVGGWRPLTEAEAEAYRARDTKALFAKSTSPVTVPDADSNPAWMRYVQVIDHGEPVGEQDSRWVDRARWVPTWLADLLSCPWCASGWVSLGIVVGVAFSVGVPAPLLMWPAVWGAGALLAARRWS